MERTTGKKHKKQGRTKPQPTAPLPQYTAPTTSTCTSPGTRHPTTTTPPGNFVAEDSTARTPWQSLTLLPAGHAEALSTATSPPSHHCSGLAPSALRSLSETDGLGTAGSRDVTTRNEKSHDQWSGFVDPSPLQPGHQVPNSSSAAPADLVTPSTSTSTSTTPSGHGDTTITARPFSARRDNIEYLRSSVSSSTRKRPAVDETPGNHPSTSHPPPSPQPPGAAARTHSSLTKPSSSAATPSPRPGKRARAAAPLAPGPRRFACPFRKKNPFAYRDNTCKHGYKRIADVKQHLYRQHMMHVCNRCGARFPGGPALTEHQRQREWCALRPDPPAGGGEHEDPAGITPGQRALLHRRADPRRDEGEQWGIMWRIVFPRLGHVEPSPSRHANGLGIARTIPEMDGVPKAAIQAFIEKIRNGLMSSGQAEDIPPPMDSPSPGDSPQGEEEEAIREPNVYGPPPPVSAEENQPYEEKAKDKGAAAAEGYPVPPTGDQMNGTMQELLFNMPLDFDCFPATADGGCWYDFGQPPLQPPMTTFQPPTERTPGHMQQADFAGPSSLSQLSVVDYLPMPRTLAGGRVPGTELEPADRQEESSSARNQRGEQGGEQT